MSARGGGLGAFCPCGHAAYLHRTVEQRAENLAVGKHYVAECAGRRGGGDTGACCQCQVDRQTVMTGVDGSHA